MDTDYYRVIASLKNRSRNEIYAFLYDVIVNQTFFMAVSGYIGIGAHLGKAYYSLFMFLPLSFSRGIVVTKIRLAAGGDMGSQWNCAANHYHRRLSLSTDSIISPHR